MSDRPARQPGDSKKSLIERLAPLTAALLILVVVAPGTIAKSGTLRYSAEHTNSTFVDPHEHPLARNAPPTAGAGASPVREFATTETPLLRSLTPHERRYVTAIAALSPAQVSAAFGTNGASTINAVLASLTAQQRRYVQAIASMSYTQLAAAFGNYHTTSGGLR